MAGDHCALKCPRRRIEPMRTATTADKIARYRRAVSHPLLNDFPLKARSGVSWHDADTASSPCDRVEHKCISWI
jgi:hypothetical protein